MMEIVWIDSLFLYKRHSDSRDNEGRWITFEGQRNSDVVGVGALGGCALDAGAEAVHGTRGEHGKLREGAWSVVTNHFSV